MTDKKLFVFARATSREQLEVLRRNSQGLRAAFDTERNAIRSHVRDLATLESLVNQTRVLEPADYTIFLGEIAAYVRVAIIALESAEASRSEIHSRITSEIAACENAGG